MGGKKLNDKELETILEFLDNGKTVYAIANLFECSQYTVERINRFRECVMANDHERIAKLVKAARPTKTVQEAIMKRYNYQKPEESRPEPEAEQMEIQTPTVEQIDYRPILQKISLQLAQLLDALNK